MGRVHPFYLRMDNGQRFCLLHTSGAPARGALLFIHPFAEEMNKCRRMAAIQARAFADAGWTVMQFDLAGCGDSTGNFGDATWQRWVDDTIEAATWLQREAGAAPGLWGLRLGCLLATQAAKSLEPIPHLILWQPVLSGRQYLQQFLRLKLGSAISAHQTKKLIRADNLREQLCRGQTIEIMGYEVAPEVAAGMDASMLSVPHEQTKIAWLEVQSAQKVGLSAVSTACIQQWRDAGRFVDARAVHGPPFWQTPELTECLALVEETVAALQSL